MVNLASTAMEIGPAIEILWKGMFGVFVVIGIIALLVAVLTRVTKD